jgi:hypothetical protein
MIEQALCFGPSLRAATQPNAFFDRAVNELLLRSFGVDEFERFVGNAVFDLLEFQIALQPAASYRPLFDLRRGVAEREPFVVEITILTQTGNHGFDNVVVPSDSLPLEQSFTQLRNGSRFRGQKLDGALECFAAKFV